MSNTVIIAGCIPNTPPYDSIIGQHMPVTAKSGDTLYDTIGGQYLVIRGILYVADTDGTEGQVILTVVDVNSPL